MKISKIGKIAVVLCAFALLCGCADKPGGSTNDSAQQSAENSSSSSSFASSDTSSEVSDVSSDKSGAVTSDIGNGMKLKGTVMDKSELKEFSLDPYMDYVSWLEADEIFDSVGIPELKDMYYRAELLIKFMWDSLAFPIVDGNSFGLETDPPMIFTADGKIYCEYGFTYESFYNYYLSIFTREATDKFLEERGWFLNYDGELFCVQATGIRRQGVHREFELVSKSDTVVEIRKTIFDYDLDNKPATEYIPELRDQYNVKTEDIKFVLTENGWRITNFEGIW